MQQAPESVKEYELLVRVWTADCATGSGCASAGQGGRVQGAVLVMDSVSLTLLAWREPDPMVTLPLSTVTRIHLYRGLVPSAEAALKEGVKGAAKGAVLGAILGAVGGAVFEGDAGEAAGDWAAFGATAGALGGIYTGIFEGVDHWETIPMKSLYSLYCLTDDRADCSPATDRGAG
jgi:hypothetical protein